MAAPDSATLPRDCSPFLVLFRELPYVHSYSPLSLTSVTILSKYACAKVSLFSSLMHLQGTKLFLFSCSDTLILLAFVLSLDSS